MLIQLLLQVACVSRRGLGILAVLDRQHLYDFVQLAQHDLLGGPGREREPGADLVRLALAFVPSLCCQLTSLLHQSSIMR